MGCTGAQQYFQGALNLVTSINTSGGTAKLWLENTGNNILQLTRIQLGITPPGGTATILFLRPPPQEIAWTFPSATLEPERGAALFYTTSVLPAGSVVEAQVEYTEVDGRSRSCQFTV